MSVIIYHGQRMECGKCEHSFEFLQNVKHEELPVVMICPACDWRYKLDEDTVKQFRLPQHDRRVPADGSWKLDFTGESVSHDRHQQLKEEVAKLPEVLKHQSAHDALAEIGGMQLTMLRMVHNLINKLEAVAENFTAEIETQLGLLTNMQEAIEPRLVFDFLQTPFMLLPLAVQDEPASLYGRWLLAPKFYQKLHGIPVGNASGFSVQLICPYSMIGNKIPLWLQTYADLPPVVELEPLQTRIVGPSLPHVWRTIPGIEPAIDHTEDSPAVNMTGTTMESRAWLVRHGCPGWRRMREDSGFMPVRKDLAAEKKPAWSYAFSRLDVKGRMLFAAPDRDDRMLFGILGLQCFNAKTAFICDRSEFDLNRKRSMGNIEWLDCDLVKHYHRLNEYKVLAVEADAPYFPSLYGELCRYQGRLIVLTGDPFFDFFTTNTWASAVYSLVNDTFYYAPQFTKPYAWRQSYKELGESLTEALTQVGFVK